MSWRCCLLDNTIGSLVVPNFDMGSAAGVYQKGKHTAEESQENNKWYKLKLKRQVADDPQSIATNRMNLLTDGTIRHDSDHMPSAAEIARYKSDRKLAKHDNAPSLHQDTCQTHACLSSI